MRNYQSFRASTRSPPYRLTGVSPSPTLRYEEPDTEVGGDLLERHTVFTGLGDADNVVAELLGVGLGHNNILPGRPGRASQIRCHLLVHQPLVQDLAEGWFGTKSELKPKTREGYRGLLDTLVLPKWGAVSVGDVTHEGVQAWISEMRSSGVRYTEKGLSPSRTIQAYQVLRGVLDYAVKRRHIAVNPALGVDLPRKVPVERRYLTHRQVEDLAAQMGEWRLLTLVLAYTGLRWGEAVALRARNVDLKRGRIQVSQSVTRVARELVEGPPKSHAHRSVPVPVPVPAFLVEELRPLIEEVGEDELVFEAPIGGFLTSWTYRSTFDAARPYKEMTPHDLRHTAASLAIQAEANIKAVQRMLGHATATLTLDRYGHLFDDDLDHLAAKLSESRAYSLRTEEEKKKVIPLRNTV